MKILYLGGLFPAEFSLVKEAQNNPNLELLFVDCQGSFQEYIPVAKPIYVANRTDVDKIKKDFQPDITIFRNWTPPENLIQSGEVLWHQEIYVTLDDGTRPYSYTPPKQAIVAYQSRPMSVVNKQHWLPYCASAHWGLIPNIVRTIPVMVATNLTDSSTGGSIKRRSMDILVKPIVEFDFNLVYAYNGIYGGLQNVSYLAPCIKPSYKLLDMPSTLSRVKIYISPTSIWYDEGCVSYKIYEAMACGCLVLTNNYIGMEAVFGKDGENLIYSNTPEDSLDKVRYYLDHEKEREEIAERGRQFITSEYSWEKHITRLAQEIKK